MSDENYIDALKQVADQTKGSVALSGVPLALLLSQLRVLIENQNTWISILLTIASLSLFISTVLSWYMSQFVQSTLAAEVFQHGGKMPIKGRKYFAFIHQLTQKDEFIYTEDGFIDLTRKIIWPTVMFMALGYLALIVLLLTVIWGGTS